MQGIECKCLPLQTTARVGRFIEIINNHTYTKYGKV